MKIKILNLDELITDFNKLSERVDNLDFEFADMINNFEETGLNSNLQGQTYTPFLSGATYQNRIGPTKNDISISYITNYAPKIWEGKTKKGTKLNYNQTQVFKAGPKWLFTLVAEQQHKMVKNLIDYLTIEKVKLKGIGMWNILKILRSY